MPIRDKVRGKIGQPRVPEWADDENEEIEGDIRPTREAALEKTFPPHEEEEEEEEKEEEVDTTPIVRKDDHLLLRRAEIVFVPTTEEEARRREGLGLEEEDEEKEEEEGEELSVWRPGFGPKIREGLELEGEDEEEEEDALAERRRRQIKEKNKKLELAFSRELAMAKPGFVPKRKRCTIAEREPLEAEEGALEEAKKRRLGSKDKESQKNMELEANVADVDTDDELNEAEEYEAWKVREIRRIKLDREVREAMLKVRNMTKEVMREWDREVREAMLKMRNMRKEVMREWERKNPEPVTLSKQKWIYMHKGAFFRSDPDDRTVKGTGNIFAPYFSAPTGEDKMDKTILPKGMQVKNSGRSGRTNCQRGQY